MFARLRDESRNEGALLFRAARNGNADERRFRQHGGQPDRQPRMRAAAARRHHHHRVRLNHSLALMGNFQRATGIAERTQRVGAAHRHDIRSETLRLQTQG